MREAGYGNWQVGYFEPNTRYTSGGFNAVFTYNQEPGRTAAEAKELAARQVHFLNGGN